jgi:hypothetical protein
MAGPTCLPPNPGPGRRRPAAGPTRAVARAQCGAGQGAGGLWGGEGGGRARMGGSAPPHAAARAVARVQAAGRRGRLGRAAYQGRRGPRTGPRRGGAGGGGTRGECTGRQAGGAPRGRGPGAPAGRGRYMPAAWVGRQQRVWCSATLSHGIGSGPAGRLHGGRRRAPNGMRRQRMRRQRVPMPAAAGLSTRQSRRTWGRLDKHSGPSRSCTGRGGTRCCGRSGPRRSRRT